MFEQYYLKCLAHASINIGLRGQFATGAGTVLDRTRPIVIIAEPGRETEAAIHLGRIGFDVVAGYLDGGIHAFENMRSCRSRFGRFG
jgi:hydroxyacylglutathione hydrolase